METHKGSETDLNRWRVILVILLIFKRRTDDCSPKCHQNQRSWQSTLFLLKSHLQERCQRSLAHIIIFLMSTTTGLSLCVALLPGIMAPFYNKVWLPWHNFMKLVTKCNVYNTYKLLSYIFLLLTGSVVKCSGVSTIVSHHLKCE